MSNRSLSRQPTRLQQIFATLAATLIAIGPLTFMSARPAAAEAHHLLDVRTLGISCDFTLPSRGGTGDQTPPALTENPTACGTAAEAPTTGHGAAPVAAVVDGSIGNANANANANAAGFSSGTPAPTDPASTPPAVPAAPGETLANTGASPTLLIVGESLMVLLLGLAIVASRKRAR